MNYISPQKWIILTPKCTEHWMKHWFFRSRGLNSSPVICNVMNGHRGGEKCINIIMSSLRLGIQRSMKVKGGWVNRKAGVEQQSTQQLVSRPSDVEFHFCSLADDVLFFVVVYGVRSSQARCIYRMLKRIVTAAFREHWGYKIKCKHRHGKNRTAWSKLSKWMWEESAEWVVSSCVEWVGQGFVLIKLGLVCWLLRVR